MKLLKSLHASGSVALWFAFGYAIPGQFVGVVSEQYFGGVPDGVRICFPSPLPALVSGVALALVMPRVTPPRFQITTFVVVAIAIPVIITACLLGIQQATAINNFWLRWWLSSQGPAMLVGAGCVVLGELARRRLDQPLPAPPVHDR